MSDQSDQPTLSDDAGPDVPDDDDVEGEPGLPPEGEDPMDGAAPSG
jgi:hypothetical protein